MQHILVVETNSLLSAGIVSLLMQDQTCVVSSVTPKDMLSLLQAVKQSQPDVLVFDRDAALFSDAQLIKAPQIKEALRDFNLRLIEISAASKLVRIYGRHQILLTQQVNLTKVIHTLVGIPNFSYQQSVT
ncbi:MAG: hypothetical protein GY803_04465 [Chloroflexi bacterium]|nr:hypothetical protein [Chloroflexota bacterium]